ncbi:hypothetical protein [Jejuia pallidilutea]|jgi:hypothetical protein|uniref:Uncharacterized protein n=1 Tax=Jejuia pallidilutea TaxID=504487 RepID=A0A090VLF3_9FLAO|nr:hypothetical protein [Jejuia pallidilutea]GAL65585.1 hypothetical protein JCM19301_4045 [Jejuia pallidilutea]GAL70146.1 hypothetical protein JCM19302_2721 [Jejuia pallidilutea]GAL88881.1 hypothetical protein JCM19538_1870 [Jejuia pallidilutea]
MNLKHTSIFNLIEIFNGKRTKVSHTISPKTHCEQKHIHDYYCDAEKPHVVANSIASNL